jgi:cytochrome c biogenesis protein CcmG/thiol:disulfide interchange protein DsbE
MTLEIRAGRLVVAGVDPGSPAGASGLLPGDALLVVDDFNLIDLDPLSPAAAMALFERPGRGDARLLVGRGTGVIGVRLPLGAPAAPAPTGPVRAGDPAPPFSGRGIRGEEVSLQALRGRPVLIEFWASWCPPCRDATIPLRRLAGSWGDRLAVIGVSLDEDGKSFEAFVYNHHLPGSQVHDGGWEGPITRLYGVASFGIPYTVLVDAGGRVAATGPSLAEIEKALEAMRH